MKGEKRHIIHRNSNCLVINNELTNEATLEEKNALYLHNTEQIVAR